MGQRGSDVTREVADLVLLDDNFATIIAATEEGRSIYANIQKFLRFLFAMNVAEVIVVVVGVLMAFMLGLRSADGSVFLPLTAVQILWINLVTDALPALALAVDKNRDTMRQKPLEPDSPLGPLHRPECGCPRPPRAAGIGSPAALGLQLRGSPYGRLHGARPGATARRL